MAGVIVVDGEVKIAYLAEPVLTGGEPRAVRKGEQIGPYRLVEGSDDRVILESGGQQVVVMLGHGGTGSAAGAGPAVSAPTPTPPRAAGPLPDPTSAPTQASGRMGGLGAESPPGDQAEQDPVKAGQERLRNWIQGLKQASEDPAARERLFKRE